MLSLIKENDAFDLCQISVDLSIASNTITKCSLITKKESIWGQHLESSIQPPATGESVILFLYF